MESAWNIYPFHMDGKTLSQLKIDMYYFTRQHQPLSSDVLIEFRDGSFAWSTFNIYWGRYKRPEDFRYFLDGRPLGNIYRRIKQVVFMSPLINHPVFQPYWEESGFRCPNNFAGLTLQVQQFVLFSVKRQSA